LTALLCSPITTIHPLVASGMIVGPVEAWARRPTVDDLGNIHRDVQSLRGFFKNRFTRTLIVTVAPPCLCASVVISSTTAETSHNQRRAACTASSTFIKKRPGPSLS